MRTSIESLFQRRELIIMNVLDMESVADWNDICD
jgi:hypothetical protein